MYDGALLSALNYCFQACAVNAAVAGINFSLSCVVCMLMWLSVCHEVIFFKNCSVYLVPVSHYVKIRALWF